MINLSQEKNNDSKNICSTSVDKLKLYCVTWNLQGQVELI